MRRPVRKPFSDGNIEKIIEAINDTFIEMAREKMDTVREDRGWDRGDERLSDIACDSDRIESKIDKIADFLRVKKEVVRSFHNEDITDDNQSEIFLKMYNAMYDSDKSMSAYVDSYVSRLYDEGTITDICDKYGEPGYTKATDDGLIITLDRNDFPKGIVEIMEENGYDIEWYDEWSSAMRLENCLEYLEIAGDGNRHTSIEKMVLLALPIIQRNISKPW